MDVKMPTRIQLRTSGFVNFICVQLRRGPSTRVPERYNGHPVIVIDEAESSLELLREQFWKVPVVSPPAIRRADLPRR